MLWLVHQLRTVSCIYEEKGITTQAYKAPAAADPPERGMRRGHPDIRSATWALHCQQVLHGYQLPRQHDGR